MTRPSVPFRNMSRTNWQNLAIAALMALYLLQVLLDIAWGNIFGNLGIDFASFWSAGVVADHSGYASVYDLEALGAVQQTLLPKTAGSGLAFHVIPTPYFPIFLLPFQLLALLPPVGAFWLWTAINAALFFWYLQFFCRKMTDSNFTPRTLALVAVSVPVFLTLFDGQVNVLLTICIGEFLRAVMEGRRMQAGLWLGGLLLKPQCLIVLVPALLLQRSWKTMAGLGIAGIIVLGTSMLLGGIAAISGLTRLWLGYAGGLPTNDVQLMTNWRMIGLLIGRFAPEIIATIAAISGTILTLLAALYLWRRTISPRSPEYAVALIGSLAATGLVAWHSHVHMAMIVLPPLLYLYLSQDASLGNKLELWVFTPGALYFLRLTMAAWVYAGLVPTSAITAIDSLTGAAIFGVNLYLLAWALQQSRRPGSIPATIANATG